MEAARLDRDGEREKTGAGRDWILNELFRQRYLDGISHQFASNILLALPLFLNHDPKNTRKLPAHIFLCIK
jgi:hypothetical protein